MEMMPPISYNHAVAYTLYISFLAFIAGFVTGWYWLKRDDCSQSNEKLEYPPINNGVWFTETTTTYSPEKKFQPTEITSKD